MAQVAQGKEDEARASFEEMIERVLERPDRAEQYEQFAAVRTALEILAGLEPSRADLVEEFEGMMVAAEAELFQPGAAPDDADAEISDLQLTADGFRLDATYDSSGLAADSRITWVGYFRPSEDEPWQQPSYLVQVNRLADPTSGPGSVSMLDTSCPGPGEYRLAGLAGRPAAGPTADDGGGRGGQLHGLLRPAEPRHRVPPEGVGARRLRARADPASSPRRTGRPG